MFHRRIYILALFAALLPGCISLERCQKRYYSDLNADTSSVSHANPPRTALVEVVRAGDSAANTGPLPVVNWIVIDSVFQPVYGFKYHWSDTVSSPNARSVFTIDQGRFSHQVRSKPLDTLVPVTIQDSTRTITVERYSVKREKYIPPVYRFIFWLFWLCLAVFIVYLWIRYRPRLKSWLSP